MNRTQLEFSEDKPKRTVSESKRNSVMILKKNSESTSSLKLDLKNIKADLPKLEDTKETKIKIYHPAYEIHDNHPFNKVARLIDEFLKLT